jgi:tetratricopeptide (TPR) repeat protein
MNELWRLDPAHLTLARVVIMSHRVAVRLPAVSRVLVLAALGCAAPWSLTSAQGATIASADSAIQAGDWATAAKRFEAITARDSTGGYAWLRLGAARHSLGDFRGAIQALEHARRIGFQPVAVRFRLARAYARLGARDRALALLDSAAQGGLPPQLIQGEHDFDGVRGDARFASIVAAAESARYPCRAMPEAKQFDFWIGQWDVTPWALESPQPGQQVGVNDVHPILEHCVVFENWRATGGGEGKSFNYFDTNLHKWRQIWMADGGGALDYTGEYRDGAMRFTGWTLDAKGNRVEQKLTFFNIAPDTVRQLFEASSDEGKTWAATFDGRYVRRKSPPSSQ